MKKPVALIILDGFGLNPDAKGNAIKSAKTPNIDSLLKIYPNSTLGASGMDVGLPDGQMGNSEVGHLNIGAGRIVYQELTRITKEIDDGNFFENEALKKNLEKAKNSNKAVHIMGLLSDGGVHSHIDHLKGLLEFCKKISIEKVYIHAFLDGRDTAPNSASSYIEELEKYMKHINIGEIATISGRYFAMDRDNRWERVQKSYDAMLLSKGEVFKSASEAIKASYNKEIFDEFVQPCIILDKNSKTNKIEEDDTVIFFNFRPDRAREITRAIVDKNFTSFERNFIKTNFVCMTQYDATIENVDIAYSPQSIKNTLGEWISKKEKKQLRIAETEKYAHVTFFFNGGVEIPNEGEDRVLVNSPKVATYDLKPEMSAFEVTDKLIKKLDQNIYDLIILNYANPDMVGHTGVFDAAVKAVETVDDCLGRVIEKIKEKNGVAIITADHGNSEYMIDELTNQPFTAHTTNRVPVIITKENISLREDGKLCDLAPTLLDLMDLQQPQEMKGITLIK